MKLKNLGYFSLLLGAILSIYSQWGDQTNKVLAAIGIVLLMFGLYTVSKGIKGQKPEEQYIKSEDEEE